MAVSKLTIIAELRDDLTKGLRKVKRTIDEVKDASSQASVAAGLQSESFKKLAKQYGWTADAYGRWHEANGRYVSKAKLADASTKAQANAYKLAGQEARRTAAGVRRLTEILTGGNRGAQAVGDNVRRLARSLGVGQRAATQFGDKFTHAMQDLPDSAARAAAGFKRSMSTIMASADKTTNYVASKFKAMATSNMAQAGAAVGGAAFMYQGAERIQALQATDVRLDVMGMTEEERQETIDTVNRNVLGTQFGLGEAAKVGSQLLGAGIEQDDFDQRMKDTVNVASLYGNGDIGEMGLVLSQVTAKGKLTGEEALQLNERSMPVYKWLADYKGVEKEEMQKMIEEGEISADDFWNAMSKQVAGGAAMMGETIKGQFNNMKASIGRASESFQRPMLDEAGTIMKMITKAFDDSQEVFKMFGEAGAEGLDKVIELLPLIGQYLGLIAPSAARLFGAIMKFLPQLIEGFIGWNMAMLPVIVPLMEIAAVLLELLGPILPVLIPILGATLVILKAFKIVGWIATLLGKLGGALRWLFAPLSGVWKLLTLLFKAAGGFTGILSKLGLLLRLFPLTGFISVILLAVQAFNWLYDNVSLVRDAVDFLSDSIQKAVEWFTNLIDKADEWLMKDINKADDWIMGDVLGKDDAKYEDAPGPLSDVVNQMTFGLLGQSTEEWAATQATGNPYSVGIGWFDEAATKDRERLGVGEYWGTGEGFFSRLHGSEANTEEEADVPNVSPPAHADGGWTSAGPHLATVGERGREFIMTASASNAIESAHPGALEYMRSTGQLPGGGGTGTTVHANVHINGAQDPVAIGDQVEAALRRLARDAGRAYGTPSERGAA